MIGLLVGLVLVGLAMLMLIPLLIAAIHMHSILGLRQAQPGRVRVGESLIVSGIAVESGAEAPTGDGSSLLWSANRGGTRFSLIDPDEPDQPVHVDAAMLKPERVRLVAGRGQDPGYLRALLDVLAEKFPVLRGGELNRIRSGDRLWLNGTAQAGSGAPSFGADSRIDNRSPDQLAKRDQTTIVVSALVVAVLFSLGLLLMVY